MITYCYLSLFLLIFTILTPNSHQTIQDSIFSLPKSLNINPYSRNLKDFIKKSNLVLNSQISYIKICIRTHWHFHPASKLTTIISEVGERDWTLQFTRAMRLTLWLVKMIEFDWAWCTCWKCLIVFISEALKIGS